MIEATQPEISVLSCLINNKETLGDVIERLNVTDFYGSETREIYSTIVELAESGKPFDIISLSEKMGEVQWLSKLGEIAKAHAHAPNISHYVDAVIDARIKRQAAQLVMILNTINYRF